MATLKNLFSVNHAAIRKLNSLFARRELFKIAKLVDTKVSLLSLVFFTLLGELRAISHGLSNFIIKQHKINKQGDKKKKKGEKEKKEETKVRFNRSAGFNLF